MATRAEREAAEAARAATQPSEPGHDAPGDDGTGAQNDDPTVRSGDAGQTEPTADPSTTDTAATLATSTITSETVAPRRYKPGDVAERTLYGTLAADGTVRPTGNGGEDEPGAGARGTIIVAQGDTITPAQSRLLG